MPIPSKDYGGYDIILIELRQNASVVEHPPACLPGSGFVDEGLRGSGSGVWIVGYGKTRRATCEVGPRGPSKFRYCGVEPGCADGAGAKYKKADCRVQFPYKVDTAHWFSSCQVHTTTILHYIFH